MKHTPGPWKVEDGGFVGGPVGYGRVCQFWNKFEEDFQNADANAQLVAAAPDLLSKVRDTLLWFRAKLDHLKYVPDTDQSGHPHGYSVIQIPDWEVRQKLAEMEEDIVKAGAHV